MFNRLRAMMGASLLLTVLLLTVPIASVNAQTAPDSSPLGALMDYYNSINQHDYLSAYNLRLNPTQTFAEFTNGFVTTREIVPYFGALQPQANVNFMDVPVVVLGYQTNGTIQSFAGCFTMENINPALGTWRINTSRIQQLAFTGEPATTPFQAFLNTPCATSQPAAISAGASQTEADASIRAYYEAINTGNFIAAYSMWMFPFPPPFPNGSPQVDHRPPYNTFAQGYATTAHITVYTGSYVTLGASAGRTYVNGYQPVVLISQNTNGTFTTFSGCYVMGRFSAGDGFLRIVDGQLNILQDGIPTIDVVLNALRAINCTAFAGSV
ncbi:MAG: hypothetical protein RLP44_22040 [Aggregatilineales bacterium]